MTDLPAQIEQEAKELAAVPKVPIQKYMGGGSFKRCHICGQVFSEHDIKLYEGKRGACKNCHPQRS